MTVKSPHPKEVRPYRYSLADRLYLPLLQGMWVTLRHVFENIFMGSRYTIEYPEERREYSHRYRGHHILTTRPDGSVRCVACFLCSTNCPAQCIRIEAGEHPDVNIEKYPVVYEIDMLRCVFCGFCVDACPKQALIMSRKHDLFFTTRDAAVVGIDELRQKGAIEDQDLGYRPYF